MVEHQCESAAERRVQYLKEVAEINRGVGVAELRRDCRLFDPAYWHQSDAEDDGTPNTEDTADEIDLADLAITAQEQDVGGGCVHTRWTGRHPCRQRSSSGRTVGQVDDPHIVRRVTLWHENTAPTGIGPAHEEKRSGGTGERNCSEARHEIDLAEPSVATRELLGYVGIPAVRADYEPNRKMKVWHQCGRSSGRQIDSQQSAGVRELNDISVAMVFVEFSDPGRLLRIDLTTGTPTTLRSEEHTSEL